MDTIITYPGTIVNQMFNGSVFVNPDCPDVTFDNCTFNGSSPEDILLTMGIRTKVVNCNLFGSFNGCHRGIRTDGKDMIILNSRVKNIFWDNDTQAIGGWDGCNGLLVKHCEFEASGEVIMFGGSTMSSPDNVPKNIMIDDCLITRKIEWRAKQVPVTCKNLVEMKNVENLTLKNSTWQYSWVDGQIGYALVLTVRQDPSPYCKVKNVKFINNDISSCANGISIQGRDNNSNNSKDGMVEKVLIRGNRFSDIDGKQWGIGDSSMNIQILRGSRNLHIIDNEFNGGVFNSFLNMGGEEELKNEGLVIVGNHGPAGLYGIIGNGHMGVDAMEVFAPGYVWNMNFVRNKDVPQIKWPTGTYDY